VDDVVETAPLESPPSDMELPGELEEAPRLEEIELPGEAETESED
jgi:hypothetical protein